MKLFLLNTLIGLLRTGLEEIAKTRDSANTSSTSITTESSPSQSYFTENQPPEPTKLLSTKSTTEEETVANPLRYGNIIRLLASASLDPNPNYGDQIDKVLGKLTDEELMFLFFGTKEEIKHTVDSHAIPPGAVDLVCCIIDGEPLSTTMAKLGANLPVIRVPPKKQQH